MRRVSYAMALAVLILLSAAACHHKRNAAKAQQEVLPVATLWAKGQAAMKKHHQATARRYFDQITLREDAGEYKDKAAIATADSYRMEHNVSSYAEAISRYQTFLAFHATRPEAAYCQYEIAECYLEEVQTPDRDITPATRAQEAYRNVVENYPNSPYVAEAKKKLQRVSDILAAHEIKVGDFYLKDKDYGGAIARYRTVIDKYPSYWNLPLVKFRLGEALYRGNQPEEAILYFRQIVQEQGTTQLAKAASKRLAQIERRDGKPPSSTEKPDKLPGGPLVEPKAKSKHWWQFWKRGE